MAGSHVVVVRIEPVEVVTGGWCDVCLLPSMVTETYVLSFPGHGPRMGSQTRCRDCGTPGQ